MYLLSTQRHLARGSTRGRNITASKVGRNFWGVVSPTFAILGVQLLQREAYEEPIGQRCYNILLVVLMH